MRQRHVVLLLSLMALGAIVSPSRQTEQTNLLTQIESFLTPLGDDIDNQLFITQEFKRSKIYKFEDLLGGLISWCIVGLCQTCADYLPKYIIYCLPLSSMMQKRFASCRFRWNCRAYVLLW